MKVVLVGAGSAQFGCGSLGDIFCSKELKGSEVALLDINAESLDKVFQVAKSFVEEKKLDFNITATTNRKEAFKGANFIISSIEVGDRFKLWDEDWKVAMQYGYHQVYGENGGPGGVFHSLRIIPPILDIVRDAMEVCPDAYIFNYSNPMTAITTTVLRAFPQAKFIGMCHEIGWLYRWLPRMLNTPVEDLHFRAAGLNHFSCMLELKNTKTGQDLYPEVLKKAHAFFEVEPGYSDLLDRFRETGEAEETEKYAKENPNIKSKYKWADRTLLKFILETYKLLPITTDSHFGEYISWAWDVAEHKGILDFYEYYKTSLPSKVPSIELVTHERAVPIMDGIISNAGFEEAAVNIQNNGLIEDLPSWIAIECPAIIDKNGLTGIKTNVPKGYQALLRNYCGVYDLTAEAVIHKSKDYAIQAMLANPIVNRCLPVKPMVEYMISQQEKWLGYLK